MKRVYSRLLSLENPQSFTQRLFSAYQTLLEAINRKNSVFLGFPVLLSKTNMSCRNEHITRQMYSTKIKEQKEKFLYMTQEDKRQHYKCGNKYKTLDKVLTWEEYFYENKIALLKKIAKKSGEGKTGVKREIRPDLNKKVSLWRGDITTLEIDAIVNAANESLLGGGGVDGAIHRAAGKKLVEECATLKGCKTGQAKITGGYKLPAKYVIHTVGPIGEQKDLLRSAYDSCLKLVTENDLVSVAFPCISTGIYGYSSEKAAPVAIETVRNWLENEETGRNIERVIFCLFLQKDVDIYEELMQVYFPIDVIEDDRSETVKEDSEVSPLKQGKDESTDTVKSKKLKKDSEAHIKSSEDKDMDSENKSPKKMEIDDTSGDQSQNSARITKPESKSPKNMEVEAISDCKSSKSTRNIDSESKSTKNMEMEVISGDISPKSTRNIDSEKKFPKKIEKEDISRVKSPKSARNTDSESKSPKNMEVDVISGDKSPKPAKMEGHFENQVLEKPKMETNLDIQSNKQTETELKSEDQSKADINSKMEIDENNKSKTASGKKMDTVNKIESDSPSKQKDTKLSSKPITRKDLKEATKK